MASLNKIMIIGNVGSDPEMRYTPNGSAVTSFSIATNRRYTTSDGEQKEETEWFRVSAWNKLAEICNQYLSKGRQTYVEGRLHSATWEGPDGQTRFRNEITAFEIVFLGSAQGGGQETDFPVPAETGSPESPSIDVENLPF